MKCLAQCPGEFISKEAFLCSLALCYVYVPCASSRSLCASRDSSVSYSHIALSLRMSASGNTEDRISYLFTMYAIVYAAERYVTESHARVYTALSRSARHRSLTHSSFATVRIVTTASSTRPTICTYSSTSRASTSFPKYVHLTQSVRAPLDGRVAHTRSCLMRVPWSAEVLRCVRRVSRHHGRHALERAVCRVGAPVPSAHGRTYALECATLRWISQQTRE